LEKNPLKESIFLPSKTAAYKLSSEITTSSSICGLLPLIAIEDINAGLYFSPKEVEELDETDAEATGVVGKVATPVDSKIRLDEIWRRENCVIPFIIYFFFLLRSS
jgi:SUMO ligase MMS21 Smc5/6 complex component